MESGVVVQDSGSLRVRNKRRRYPSRYLPDTGKQILSDTWPGSPAQESYLHGGEQRVRRVRDSSPEQRIGCDDDRSKRETDAEQDAGS